MEVALQEAAHEVVVVAHGESEEANVVAAIEGVEKLQGGSHLGRFANLVPQLLHFPTENAIIIFMNIDDSHEYR